MRPISRILAGFVVLAAVAAVAIGPLGLLERDAGEGSDPSPSVAAGSAPVQSPTPTRPPDPPAASQGPLSPDEQAFAEAYRTLAETYDHQATDLLIANPLSEFDLVGSRLTDLIDRTRQQLAGLPPLALTADQVRAVEREMAAALALLREVDPHGPQGEQATTYQRALDYWVEHVQPVSDAIRAALGLPPSATGDLRL